MTQGENPYRSPAEMVVNLRRRIVSIFTLTPATPVFVMAAWWQESNRIEDTTEDALVDSIREYGGWRGGAHILMEDEGLEGDQSLSSDSGLESPHGLWGALGTRADKD